MLKEIKFFFLILVYYSNTIYCQKTISFIPLFNESSFETDKKYSFLEDSTSISTLKFYISNIQLLQDSLIVYSEKKLGHLIDFKKENPYQLYLNSVKEVEFNQLYFQLGIDSTTNMDGVKSNDLDPSNGMYWTWQSGYINYKMEGTSKICPARKNSFQFHIGGYQYPYNSLQKVTISTNTIENINLYFDLEELLLKIDISSTFQIMSPSEKSNKIAKLIGESFYIK